MGTRRDRTPRHDSVLRRILRRGVLADHARHTDDDVQLYADGRVLEFGTRGQFTNAEGEVRIGDLFYGPKGWLWIDETGRRGSLDFGPKNEPGPGTEEGPEAAPARR